MKTTRLLSASLLWLATTVTSVPAQNLVGFNPSLSSTTQLKNFTSVTVNQSVKVEPLLPGLRTTKVTSVRPGVPAPRRQATTFIGAVTGTTARIALLSDGITAAAFVTDGAASTSHTAWLEGTEVNGVLKLDGAPCLPRPSTAPSLTGTVTATTVRGSIRIAGKTRSFSALKTTSPSAGVYHRAEQNALVAMIVDDRGVAVGAARHLSNRLLGRARIQAAPSQGAATVSVSQAGTSTGGTVRLKQVREPLPGMRWLWNNRPSSATKAAVVTELGAANHLGQPIKPFDIQVVPNPEAVSVFMFTDHLNQSVMLNHPLLDAFETGTLMEQANFRDTQIQVYDLALSQGQAAISTQHFQNSNNSTIRTDCRVELAQLQANATLLGTGSISMGAQAGAAPPLSGLSSLVLFDAGTRVTRVPNGGFLMTNPGTPVDVARRHFGNVHYFAPGATDPTLLVQPLISPIVLPDRAIALHLNGATRVALGSSLFLSRDDGGMLHTFDSSGIAPAFRPLTLTANFLNRSVNKVHAADMADMDGNLLIAVNGRSYPATQAFGGLLHASDTRCRDFWALLLVRPGGAVEVLAHVIDTTLNTKGELDAAITGIDVLQAPEGSHILMADNGVRTPGTSPMGPSSSPTTVSPAVSGPLPPPNDQHLATGRILRWSPSQQAADALELRTLQERQRRNP
jgi:hypothetical protein